MPIDGLLTRWNDDRGFGFITPAVGGQEIFIHISAFPKDGRRPKVGELLAFEIEIDAKGKKRAKSVTRPVRAGAVRAAQREYAPPRRKRGLLGYLVPLVIMVGIAVYGSGQYSRIRDVRPFVENPTPGRIESPDAATKTDTAFRCDGRQYCSQMTSCAEATFFLRNCPGTKMDGDRDGIPCEEQFCR
jgi:cold shock CspA family protein